MPEEPVEIITIESINEKVKRAIAHMKCCYYLGSQWDREDFDMIKDTINYLGSAINALIQKEITYLDTEENSTSV